MSDSSLQPSPPTLRVPRTARLKELRDLDTGPEWSQLVSVTDGGVSHPTTLLHWTHTRSLLVLDVVATARRLRSRAVTRNDPAWEDDVLELFLDPVGGGRVYREIEVAPTGAVFDAWVKNTTDLDDPNAPRRIEHAFPDPNALGPSAESLLDGHPSRSVPADRLADGLAVREWRVRWRIPLLDLLCDAEPGAPLSLRANVYRIQHREDDGESLTGDRIHQAWSPTGRLDFHRPEAFGVLELEV